MRSPETVGHSFTRGYSLESSNTPSFLWLHYTGCCFVGRVLVKYKCMVKIKFSEKKLKEIAREYGLIDVYVFGSKITGYAREGSDLDVAVRFENGLPPIEKRGRVYGDIFSDLTSVFKGEKIDLTFIEEAPLHLQFKIVTEGELVYSKEKIKSLNFLEKVVNQYRDYKFFIDEYFQGVLARKA